MQIVSDVVELIGQTPIIELRAIGAKARVPIFAKCEHLNPGGSVKDRIALAIIKRAIHEGTLTSGTTIVEATAGNTGVGLALVGKRFGHPVVCVMPEKVSPDKREALRIMGAEVIMTPNTSADDPAHFRAVAARLAKERGWFLADQFRNPANVEVHERETGREIIEALGADLGAFVSGCGTGGTLTGVGRALRRANDAIEVVLADPFGSSLADWITTGVLGPSLPYTVEGIGGSLPPENLDRSVITRAMTITDDESYAMTRRLIHEEGLLVGGTSGTNVAAALRLAREKDTRGPVVTLLTDSWDRYRARPWMKPDVTP